MQTLLDIVLAAATLASLVLHYLGKKNPKAEKLADQIDAVEDEVKDATGK
jgi:hypothetical protein